MVFSVNGTRLIQDAELPIGIVVSFLPRKNAVVTGVPPDLARTVGSSTLGDQSRCGRKNRRGHRQQVLDPARHHCDRPFSFWMKRPRRWTWLPCVPAFAV